MEKMKGKSVIKHGNTCNCKCMHTLYLQTVTSGTSAEKDPLEVGAWNTK